MNLQEWKKQHNPLFIIHFFPPYAKGRAQSKLSPFQEDIMSLYDEGYSISQILDYLEEAHQIKVSRPALFKFISIQIVRDAKKGGKK